MKGLAFDSLDKRTVAVLINNKIFFDYVDIKSNFDLDTIKYILSDLAILSCRECECDSMTTTEMEYLVTKFDDDDWEFQCQVCMGTALLFRLLTNKTIPKESLINVLNHLSKDNTMVAMITNDLVNFDEEDINLSFTINSDRVYHA